MLNAKNSSWKDTQTTIPSKFNDPRGTSGENTQIQISRNNNQGRQHENNYADESKSRIAQTRIVCNKLRATQKSDYLIFLNAMYFHAVYGMEAWYLKKNNIDKLGYRRTEES